MNSYAEQLSEIQERCKDQYSLTEDERTLVHNAYWSGNDSEISTVLEIACFDPDLSDVPMLLDASSPGSLWVHRCDAAQVLGGLGDEGAAILRIMAGREKHPLVRFYVLRELIDLSDETVDPLLDGGIPPNSSPHMRKLWIYGNFERGNLSREDAFGYMKVLLSDSRRGAEWLRDHIQDS